jgi:hypothetical protein
MNVAHEIETRVKHCANHVPPFVFGMRPITQPCHFAVASRATSLKGFAGRPGRICFVVINELHVAGE